MINVSSTLNVFIYLPPRRFDGQSASRVVAGRTKFITSPSIVTLQLCHFDLFSICFTSTTSSCSRAAINHVSTDTARRAVRLRQLQSLFDVGRPALLLCVMCSDDDGDVAEPFVLRRTDQQRHRGPLPAQRQYRVPHRPSPAHVHRRHPAAAAHRRRTGN